MWECQSVSEGDVIERHECTIPASVSRLSTSKTG
jgi:hypothetical protein